MWREGQAARRGRAAPPLVRAGHLGEQGEALWRDDIDRLDGQTTASPGYTRHGTGMLGLHGRGVQGVRGEGWGTPRKHEGVGGGER